ncbi:MAG: pyridoxamine 5'-phosphate oxidase family protein [Bacteroidota bacterium]
MQESDSLQSQRSKVRRVPDRGHYDRATVDRILDAHFLCHIGFVVDGKPFVIPTLYARDGDYVLIHGATKSRMLMALQQGIELCFSVTLVDALVLARSAFHHSVNYRSIILYGVPELVSDPAEKLRAMEVLTNGIVPGRYEEVRQPAPNEIKATSIMRLKIAEGAAKVRDVGVKDDKADYELDIWAGLIPFSHGTLPPVPDPAMPEGIPVPPSVLAYAQNE